MNIKISRSSGYQTSRGHVGTIFELEVHNKPGDGVLLNKAQVCTCAREK